MKTAALAFALLLSGAAIAQTTTTPPDVDVDANMGVQPDGDLDVDADVDVDPGMTTTTATSPTTHSSMNHNATTTDTSTHGTMNHMTTGATPQASMSNTTLAANTTPASAAVVQPSNANPEHDARGIAVISDPAVVPAGYNNIAATAVGGPLVDPTTGAAINAADDTYPACSASVTDNCLQTYERGRSR